MVITFPTELSFAIFSNSDTSTTKPNSKELMLEEAGTIKKKKATARNKQHLQTQISRDFIPDTVSRLMGRCLHVRVHLRWRKFPIHCRKRQRGTREEQPLVRAAGLWIDELMVTDEGNKELDVPPVTSEEPVWITHLRPVRSRRKMQRPALPPSGTRIYDETHTQTRPQQSWHPQSSRAELSYKTTRFKREDTNKETTIILVSVKWWWWDLQSCVCTLLKCFVMIDYCKQMANIFKAISVGESRIGWHNFLSSLEEQTLR